MAGRSMRECRRFSSDMHRVCGGVHKEQCPLGAPLFIEMTHAVARRAKRQRAQALVSTPWCPTRPQRFMSRGDRIHV